jgi:antitoxin component of RelBE/YafQ-DinJ toxin-antitoxin module
MAKTATAEVHVPEIRFRPSADVYAKAARVAEGLGITVTEVARMGLAQISSAREIRLEPLPPAAQGLRDLPVHGVSVGRIAEIAAAAARGADRSHVKASRLEPARPRGIKR